MAQPGNFKFTQNQLNEVDMGLVVTTVADPNRVVITDVNGYLTTSDITYTQLLAIIEGGGSGVTADNGLTMTSGNVQLGGVLVKDTDIDLDNYDFSFQASTSNGLGSYTFSQYNCYLYQADPFTNRASNLLIEGARAQLRSQDGNTNTTKSILFRVGNGIGISVLDDNEYIGLRYLGDYSANNTGANYNALWIPSQGAVIQNQTSLVQSASFRALSGQLQGGGSCLKIGTNTGNPDHANIVFYARTANPNQQTGTVGFNGVGTNDMSVVNYISTGNLLLGANITTVIQVYGVTKNVTIQDGGTFTDDTVNRLQVSGSGIFRGGAETLKVSTSATNPDHAYIGFYARTATPAVQSGYMGYNGVGTTILTVQNSLSGGFMNLSTTGTNTRITNFATTTRFSPAPLDNQDFLASVNSGGGVSNFTIEASQTAYPSGATFRGAGYQGTIGSKTVAVNGTPLVRLLASGFESNILLADGASIIGSATATWAAGTNHGAKWDFYTTPNGTAVQQLALTIDQDQSVRTWSGAESLKVGTNTGKPDHAYIGLYARTATPTTQSGMIGYTSAGSSHLLIYNSVTSGNVQLMSQSGYVQAAGTKFTVAPSSSSNYLCQLGQNNADTENVALIETALGSFSNGSKVIVRTAGTTSGTVTLNTNVLGQYVFSGYKPSSQSYDSASIRGIATEAWSSTIAGTRLEVYTTPNGTVTQALALKVDQDQSLSFKYASSSVDPTATEIPAGFSKVYLNTTSGVLKLWSNQAGTLKSVTLT